jgi:hypothetical protein
MPQHYLEADPAEVLQEAIRSRQEAEAGTREGPQTREAQAYMEMLQQLRNPGGPTMRTVSPLVQVLQMLMNDPGSFNRGTLTRAVKKGTGGEGPGSTTVADRTYIDETGEPWEANQNRTWQRLTGQKKQSGPAAADPSVFTQFQPSTEDELSQVSDDINAGSDARMLPGPVARAFLARLDPNDPALEGDDEAVQARVLELISQLPQ